MLSCYLDLIVVAGNVMTLKRTVEVVAILCTPKSLKRLTFGYFFLKRIFIDLYNCNPTQ